MIDFVSTRGVDHETAACARLLSAVISQAIKDACIPLSESEKKRFRNEHEDAAPAIRFLFEEDSIFDLYATLIGSSAKDIRAALMQKTDHGLKEAERRILHARVRFWRNHAQAA